MINLRCLESVAKVYEVHDDGHRILGFSNDFRFEFEARLGDRPAFTSLRRGRIAALDVVSTGASWTDPLAQFKGQWMAAPRDAAVRKFINELIGAVDS